MFASLNRVFACQFVVFLIMKFDIFNANFVCKFDYFFFIVGRLFLMLRLFAGIFTVCEVRDVVIRSRHKNNP